MQKAHALQIQDILVLVLLYHQDLHLCYILYSHVSITDVFHPQYAINNQF